MIDQLSPRSCGADVSILATGTAEINRWTNANPGKVLDLRKAELEGIDLSGALLGSANLSNARFIGCKFIGATFDQATLVGAHFIHCNLERATFRKTRLNQTLIGHCKLDSSSFEGSTGFSEIRGIQSCVVDNSRLDVFIELRQCRFLDRYLDWAHIRTVGQLRLFLPSYVGVMLSTLVLSAIALINSYFAVGHNVVEGLLSRGNLDASLADKLLRATEPLQPSWRHFAVLGATLALAFGATVYLLCPPRIREFTLDQWKYTASRPTFEYHVSSWDKPIARLSCAAAYLVGGSLALALLADTLLHLILILWQVFVR